MRRDHHTPHPEPAGKRARVHRTGTTEGPACTGEEVPSVRVTLTDADGAPLTEPEISYVVDDDEPVACDHLDEAYTEFACGYETPGQFGGCLGAHYDPFVLNADPNADDFRVESISLPEGMSKARLDERMHLLETIADYMMTLQSDEYHRAPS